MRIQTIKTRVMRPPKDDLLAVMAEVLPPIKERSVVVVTSKVVAIHQGRCLPEVKGIDRDRLTQEEADLYAPRDIVPGEHILFSVKNQVLIASAGIDMSNANGHLILWPNHPMAMAQMIGEWLVKRDRLKEVGVIVTDSHVVMMRRGTQGVAIGWWGFNPVRDYRGKPDIFGRKLVVQTANVVDSLACAAVLEMGEGKEQTPLAIITQIGEMEFSTNPQVMAGQPSLVVPLEEDLFRPMLEAVPWKKGRGGLTAEEFAKLKAKTQSTKENS